MISKTKVDLETTRQLNPEELEELIYNKAADKYLGTFGEHFISNDKDELLCQIFACFILDANVKNGGFEQFFLNYEDLAKFALVGLQKIKAIEQYQLLLLAWNTFLKDKNQFTSKRNPHLSELDEKYYELEDMDAKRQKFIKENLEMFYD